ncbi:hypothetical protein [Bifidobacterium sp. ESL0819]|uniref:hypothetical protein n=1 Tax=Bifidobacterium sp. ESL0819 TaxID=3448589 RepID=UPI0040434039
MLQMGKDWRALIGNACWSWILGYIPMIFKAISIATTNYSFDGTYILSQETGLITKKTTNVDLRRAKMINATDSPFSGGSITIMENNGRSYQFPYIKHAREVAQDLRSVAEESSRQAGDVRNVIIA